MRGKIIAVFALVVLVVGGLSYTLTRATLGDFTTPGESPRALAVAAAQLRLDALLLERWLASELSKPKLRDPFNAGTERGRFEGARLAADTLRQGAVNSPELGEPNIQLVAVVDKTGKVLARNGSTLMAGVELGAIYPALRETLAQGATGSDVWVNRERNEQLLASFAPIRDADGSVIGGVVVGTALNDERLTTASQRTSGRMLVAAVRVGDTLQVVAKSRGVTPELTGAIATSPAKETALQALATKQLVDLGGMPREYSASARALDGYGNGQSLLLVSFTRQTNPLMTSSLLWPALGASLVGIILVLVGAFFLDQYISRPISELEEGLLAIMNGRTELRFEIEHAELGGLVFRINSLLNQLFQVQEDETDDQGRPSRAPEAASFEDALSVDERMASMAGEDLADIDSLKAEVDVAYYARLCEEYVNAKREIGDPVDHITIDNFKARIIASENELRERHGKPFRYKLELRGKEVILVAVPLE